MSEKLTGGIRGNFNRFLPDSGLVLEGGNISGTNLLDLQVNGTTSLNFRKNGYITATTTGVLPYSFINISETATPGVGISMGSSQAGITTFAIPYGYLAVKIAAGVPFGFSNNSNALTGTQDVFLTRRGLGNLRLGNFDAAAPVAQILSVQSVVAGTTDTAGVNLTITGSQGTGTGAGGSILFQVAPAGSTGSSQNALVEALSLSSTRALRLTHTGDATNGSFLQFYTNGGNVSNIEAGRVGTGGFGNILFTVGGSSAFCIVNSAGRSARVPSTGDFSWSINGNAGDTADLLLFRDAANTLAQRNGVNAQASRIYGTYTDASNYERLSLSSNATASYIQTENAGTGVARPLYIGSNTSTKLVITAGGNVGIGNTAPTNLLSVNGDVFVNTSVTVGNSTVIANSTGLYSKGGTQPLVKRAIVVGDMITNNPYNNSASALYFERNFFYNIANRATITDSGTNAAGQTWTRTYTLRDNEFNSANGLTYVSGELIVYFWSGGSPASMSLRVYNEISATWSSSYTGTDVGLSNFGMYRFTIPSGNYTKTFELTFVNTAGSAANFQDIEYYPALTENAKRPVPWVSHGDSFQTFGGSTSSFPALKRSGTSLQVRLADDSNFSSLFASSLTVGNSTVNSTINSTSFSGTANNASYLGGVAAANVISNAQFQANLANYAPLAGATFTGAVVVSNNLTVTGNLTLSGNTVIVGANNLVVSDALISLHTVANLAPLTSNDGKNIGIALHYYDVADKHALLYRDNSTGRLQYHTDGDDPQTNSNPQGSNLGIIQAASFYAGNSTVYTTVNSTAFTGTANNSTYAYGKQEANLNVNSALTANSATYLSGTAGNGYQTTAGLSANVATLAANSATYANASITNTFTVGTSTYFTAGGNVGIGTAAPSNLLEANNGTTGPKASFIQWSTAVGDYTGILFGVTQAAATGYKKAGVFFERTGASAVGKLHLSVNGIADTSSADLSSARLTIDGSGNVGIGNTAPAHTLSVNGTTYLGGVATVTGNLTIDTAGELIIANGAGIYANGSLGTAGQVLSSNGSGVYWTTPSAGFSNGSSISVNNFVITGAFTANSSNGSLGQVLTSNGSGVYWSSATGPRVSSTTTTTSPFSWNSDNFEQYAFTALANALTINADSGTATDGRKIIFRFLDNGTGQALTWTTGSAGSFRAVGVSLPTTTVANKVMYVGCIYNSNASRWDVISLSVEA